jgi:hypothetical protein
MRENEAAVQDMAGQCLAILDEASSRLKILDPELGEEELIKSVAAERAKLALMMAGKIRTSTLAS